MNRLPQPKRFDGKKLLAIRLLIFYRQTKIDIVRRSTNNEVFRAPNPSASQFIGFFGEADVDCARLIRCWHTFQQNLITQVPRVVAARPPKLVRALRGILAPVVTKFHMRLVRIDCSPAQE